MTTTLLRMVSDISKDRKITPLHEGTQAGGARRFDDKVNDLSPWELIDSVNEFPRMARPRDLKAMTADFRRFNRFYMRKLHPLREAMRGPGLHQSHLRVLRELGEFPGGVSAAAIAWHLGMDPAHVSRILRWFRSLGYLEETRDPRDGRCVLVGLSRHGMNDYQYLQRRAEGVAQLMLMLLPPADRNRMMAAMAEIEGVLKTVQWDDIHLPTYPSSDRECD
ncbi:MAG: MarR family winged helix-turn-helix transcriptional regulator [Usitatibacter sp.]